MRIRPRKVVAVLVILLVVVATAYFVALPTYFSDRHVEETRALALRLDESFNKLDETVDILYENDDAASKGIKKEDARQIAEFAKVARGQLVELKTASENFSALPYSEALGQYRRARINQDRIKRFIGQGEDAIRGYENMTVYLEAFHQTTNEVIEKLSEFNKVEDIALFNGHADQVRQTADGIRAASTALSEVECPEELKPLNLVTLAAFSEAASGFDDLAGALVVAADETVYAAVHRIEMATTKVEGVKNKAYSDSLSRSQIIKNIRDLEEKLDFVLER